MAGSANLYAQATRRPGPAQPQPTAPAALLRPYDWSGYVGSAPYVIRQSSSGIPAVFNSFDFYTATYDTAGQPKAMLLRALPSGETLSIDSMQYTMSGRLASRTFHGFQHGHGWRKIYDEAYRYDAYDSLVVYERYADSQTFPHQRHVVAGERHGSLYDGLGRVVFRSDSVYDPNLYHFALSQGAEYEYEGLSLDPNRITILDTFQMGLVRYMRYDSIVWANPGRRWMRSALLQEPLGIGFSTYMHLQGQGSPDTFSTVYLEPSNVGGLPRLIARDFAGYNPEGDATAAISYQPDSTLLTWQQTYGSYTSYAYGRPGGNLSERVELVQTFHSPAPRPMYRFLFQENSPVANQVAATNWFILYPNPAKESVHIKATANKAGVLMNSMGQVLTSFTTGAGGQADLTLSHLDAGLYFVRIGIRPAQRLVVE